MTDIDAQPPPAGASGGRGASIRAVPADEEQMSFAAILAVLLRHRRVMVGLPALGAVLWLVVLLVLPKDYTSHTAFTPSSTSPQLSQLTGLAAQFGVNVPLGGETNESSSFYASLLKSRALLGAAVETSYTFPTSADSDADTLSGELVEIWGEEGRNRGVQVDKAVEKLQGRLSIGTDASTGLVTLDVTTHWSALSRDVAQRIVALVNDFNLQSRQSQATAERRFLERRISQARADLRAIEDSTQIFLEHNRSYQDSPELQFKYDRYQRRIGLQQQVVMTLAQSLEKAKVDEVRNTPVITIVEPALRPARPDKSHAFLKMILGAVLGGIVAFLWAFTSEWARRASREATEDFLELERLWRDTRRDLAALGAKLRWW